MLNRLLLAIAILLLCAEGASAASFDCAKASTAIEHAICDTPDLSRSDETLAVAYATAIGGLSNPAAETMRTGQRAWLDYVQIACSDDATIPDVYSDSNLSCLQSEFSERIRVLQNSRMLSGWRLFLTQSYAAAPDSDPDSNQYAPVGTKQILNSLIDGSDPLAKAFNAYVDDYVKQAVSRPVGEKGSMPVTEDASSDYSFKVFVDEIGSDRITATVSDYWYEHGAAHGTYTISYLHFLREEKRPLEASDIFQGDGWQDKLTALAQAALKDELGDLMWDDGDASLAVTDPARWNFTDRGLILQYWPYEVASYADGAVTVTIPWTKLQDDLAPNAMAIATY